MRNTIPEALPARARALLLSLVLVVVGACSPRARAQEVQLEGDFDHRAVPANTKQTAYLRAALRGFELRTKKARAPLNVAIVIDRSGSMQGAKIQQAKVAARAALSQLRSDDIVSIIAYDDTVEVLVPATKVSDRAVIERGIARLRAGGMTALFAGVVKGANEARKFLSRERVNRVILLSDGAANVGPSSAGELGRLGSSLRREGIAVTTVGLGLGYNEDLMVDLAQQSGGQHVFIEHERQLADVFREGFSNMASIVAKEVVVTIELAEGLRAVRVLGRPAETVDIVGQRVTVRMPALYAEQLDDIVLEVEVRALPPQTLEAASIEVRYHNTATRQAARVRESVSLRISEDPRHCQDSEVPEVRVAVLERIANEKSWRAIKLRDAGQIEEARKLLEDNAKTLGAGASRYKSQTLDRLSKEYNFDADNLEEKDWGKQRKVMNRRNAQSPYQLDDNNF